MKREAGKILLHYLYAAEFAVLTDHKPLTFLFTEEINDTKVQRRAILLAELGCKIQYRRDKNQCFL